MDTNSNTEASPLNTPHAQTLLGDLVRDPNTGLYILGVGEGTPTSRVGLPSTTQQVPIVLPHVGDGARPSQVEDTSTSSAEEETLPILSPSPPIDLLDMRARRSLEVYRENCPSINKVPYVELEINDVVRVHL